MRDTHLRSISFAAAIWAVAGTAVAADPNDLPIRLERQHRTYTIESDGRYSETVETAVKVLKENGVAYAKDSSIGYSTSIQQADILSAYTLKADGRKIEVPKGNFQINSSRGRDGDSPVYSDRTSLTVVFPDLAVGDTTVVSYRLTAREPMFEGHFSVLESFDPTQYYGDVRVVFDAPVEMKTSHAVWRSTPARERIEKGRRILEWNWRNREPVDPDTVQDALFDVERYPGYAYSSFPGYAEIARAYGDKANAKAAVTPRIATLANELAGEAVEPREIAKRLYDWVAREISYAGNCIGLGAVVPRDLDIVLDNRMGDCKDHATLLQALLKAKGIDSTQALVNAGGVYTLPNIPVASMVNHVINYVPSLDLYLDSTASTVPFGSLPKQVAGKRVLLVDGYRDDAKTPLPQNGDDWQKLQARFAIAADGSVRGTVRVETGGRAAVAAREHFRDYGEEQRAQLVKDYFRMAGMIGDGKVRIEMDEAAPERFAMEADIDVQHFLPVPAGFQVASWFMSPMPIERIVSAQQPDPGKPAGESACGGVRVEEAYAYEFAPALRIAAIPADATIVEGPVSFRARYRRDGNRVVVDRLLDDRTAGPVCSPEYNATYGQFMKKTMDNLRAQIVFLRAEAATP